MAETALGKMFDGELTGGPLMGRDAGRRAAMGVADVDGRQAPVRHQPIHAGLDAEHADNAVANPVIWNGSGALKVAVEDPTGLAGVLGDTAKNSRGIPRQHDRDTVSLRCAVPAGQRRA